MGVDYANRTDQLHSYFERSAAAVTQTFDRLDKKYIQPGMTKATQSFVDSPIRSTFLAIFAALSFLPLLSFIGFSLFVLGACTFIALSVALVVSSAAIAFIGFWLAITLVALFLVSFFLTNTMIGAYLFLRYVTLVRANGPRTGSVEFVQELKSRVRGRTGRPAPAIDTQEIQQKDEQQDDAKSDGSAVDDNTVIIGEESPDRRFSFKDLDGRDSPVFVKAEPVHEVPAVTELDNPTA